MFVVDSKDEEEDVGLRLGEPLPDWLIQAMALVHDPTTGEQFLQTSKTTTTNNRNMSKSKGWTLQSSLLMLWMEKTLVNNQTTIDDNWKTY